MNKYTLSFRNPKIENQYQIHQQETQRIQSFNTMSIGFMISFGLRIIIAIVGGDYTLFYYKIALFVYLVLQYVIIRCKPQYTRIAFILTNLTNLVLNLENDSQTTVEISYLKGANTMAVNFLVILAGEFPESVIVFSIQTIYRLTSVFILGPTINWNTIFSCVSINLACFIYFYYYHKAKRSQFLLTLVDDCWDKILQELISDSYILLKFNFDNLQFKIEKVKDFIFSKSMNADDINIAVMEIFRKSFIRKETIEAYLYQQILRFQKSPQDKFNQTVFSRFEKKIIELEIQIFQANNPIIVLKIKKNTVQSIQSLKSYKDRFCQYNLFIIKFLRGLEMNYHVNNVKRIRRKLISIQLLEQICCSKFSVRFIMVEQVIHNIGSLFPEKILTLNDPYHQTQLKSIKNIVVLLFMKILENSTSTSILINLRKCQRQIEIQFVGEFKATSIIYVLRKLKVPFHQIIEKWVVQKQKLSFTFYDDPFFPLNHNSELLI